MILMLMVALPLFTGCDFFRKLAGRPTSEDIENKRIAIMRAEEAAHQARQDSIMMEQQKVIDSIAVMDSLKQQKSNIIKTDSLGGLLETELDARYYIIVGSFRSKANAESLLATAATNGYAPTLISFKNGLIAVRVGSSDNIKDAFASLNKVRTEKFCPADAWILVNE